MSSSKDERPDLDEVVAGIEKQHGAGSIMMLGSKKFAPVDVIPTSSLALDDALGIGGLPRGRVIEIYGPECLHADTFIHYEVRTSRGRANAKGGTIKRLYERFNNIAPSGDGRGKYPRCATKEAKFFASAMNDQGRIVQNEIKDVVCSGFKPCFKVQTEDGRSITASRDHQFLTRTGFSRLANLAVGDVVFIHNNTPFKVEKLKDSSRRRVDLYVRHHPIAGIKTVLSVVNRTTGEKKAYPYHRIARARAVVEASLNHLSLEQYLEFLDSGNLDGFVFLSRDQHVHHKDEDEANDVLDNLEVISSKDHGRLHATERHNNLRFIAVPTKITSIVGVGSWETYDLVMAEPYRNFVADGFVVHNSGGKTTLSLHVIAETQKLGGKAAFIDAEHALDPVYARKLGVDVDHLLISQPDNGEQALEITESLVKSGKIAVIVVDSVAALVPKAELEGDMGDAQMGLQARLMSQAMRKLTGITNQTKTTLIFINQIRDKIGVMFGSPETTTGGRALKFYASVRLDIRKIQVIKDGDKIIGADTRIKVVKNKMASPFREAEVRILYGHGISREYDLVKLGEAHNVLKKTGNFFSYKGENIGQGVERARLFLVEHSDVAAKLNSELRTLLFKKE